MLENKNLIPRNYKIILVSSSFINDKKEVVKYDTFYLVIGGVGSTDKIKINFDKNIKVLLKQMIATKVLGIESKII